MKNFKNYIMRKSIIGLFVVVVVLGICVSFFYYTTGETINIKVNDKERVVTGSGENMTSKYLVFTENEVFQNVDDILLLKFNSSDLQGQLKLDTEYEVKVYGWRIPMLSMYRNITYIKE